MHACPYRFAPQDEVFDFNNAVRQLMHFASHVYWWSQAGQDSLRRDNMKDMLNKTRNLIKGGGLTEAERAFGA